MITHPNQKDADVATVPFAGLSAWKVLISGGIVKPITDSVFPMDQTAAAYDKLATGRSVGKIVIAVK